jgi:hypothetical protein
VSAEVTLLVPATPLLLPLALLLAAASWLAWWLSELLLGLSLWFGRASRRAIAEEYAVVPVFQQPSNQASSQPCRPDCAIAVLMYCRLLNASCMAGTRHCRPAAWVLRKEGYISCKLDTM